MNERETEAITAARVQAGLDVSEPAAPASQPGGDRRNTPAVRVTLFIVGCVLLALAPVVGVIPGPGGVFFAAAGLTLILKNSRWAKRRYVRFKRWQPKAGSWFDWGLRRQSARRREALRKLQQALPEASDN